MKNKNNGEDDDIALLCTSCGVKNKLKASKLHLNPICGKCKKTLMSLEPPSPDRFDVTHARIEHYRKATEKKYVTAIILGIVSAVIIGVADIIPRSIPFLFALALAYIPGYIIGYIIEERRILRVKSEPAYSRFLEYQRVVAAHEERTREIRRQEFKRKDAESKSERWWETIDGHSFELEVTKILLSKGYDVKHTGSQFGDEGVDLLLRLDNKLIIIQCKAFKDYLNAGVVRELYGTLIHQKADEGWLVVTSGFYEGAWDFAKDKPIRLMTIQQVLRLPVLSS